jgi:hypothetical protein
MIEKKKTKMQNIITMADIYRYVYIPYQAAEKERTSQGDKTRQNKTRQNKTRQNKTVKDKPSKTAAAAVAAVSKIHV